MTMIVEANYKTYKPLDTLEGFVQRCQDNAEKFAQMPCAFEAASIYCPGCGDLRRVDVYVLFFASGVRGALNIAGNLATIAKQLTPSLFRLICVQCKTGFTGMVYQSPKGPDLIILSSHKAGLTTPNTPTSVAYYLDQAYRSESAGARSGAVAMFRAALDHLLFDQGYQKGMLGQRLEVLEKDIAVGKAPKWAMDLDTEFLTVLNHLGAGAIHTNDGDITKQDEIDSDLLHKIKETFQFLLFIVYEAPKKKAERLDALRAKSHQLRK